jgi:hypothetical protein
MIDSSAHHAASVPLRTVMRAPSWLLGHSSVMS